MCAANFKMLKHIPVFRVAVVSVLALAICGVKVIAEESLGVTEGEKEASGGENNTSSSDNWVENLSWNLLGYATIIIPAAFIIRMLKNSNFNEKSGTGCLFRSVQLCVFGTPQETPSVEEGGIKAKEDTATPSSFSKTTLKLLFCAAGLQVSYLTWGVLQERIMTRDYKEYTADGTVQDVKFTNSQFLVFVNRVLALTVALIYIVFTRQPRHTAPLYKYSFCSFSNIMSSWCQYEALKFVSFPTQVLCKASKIIPVMIMGKIVSNKVYPYYEYVVAVLLSAGVSMFLLSADPSGKRTTAATTFSGAVILLGYMAFDSFTSNWQSELFTTYKMSSMQMMFGVNLFSCFLTMWSMIEGGNFLSALWFMLSHPEFAFHALLLSIMSATGQLFIFYTIQSFGPIVFTIIMTTRMMLSILLSCILYNHPLSAQAVFGVLVVFVALFLRVYARYRISKSSTKA